MWGDCEMSGSLLFSNKLNMQKNRAPAKKTCEVVYRAWSPGRGIRWTKGHAEPVVTVTDTCACPCESCEPEAW